MSKIQNIFQNLGKSPNGLPPTQIHQSNVYFQALEETKAKGRYEQSVKALAPTTYQEANKVNFLFAKWFALLYHFVSALLGLATVCMLVYFFSGLGSLSKYPVGLIYFMFGLVFLVLSALLIGIEIFKSSLAKGIFKRAVINEKVNLSPVIGLGFVMLFSILISAVGGAVLSFSINDQTEQISKNFNIQNDSLRKLHEGNLEAVNANIKAYQNNLNKGNYWAKYATREKLSKAIEVRNDLLKATHSQQTVIETAKEKEIQLNSEAGKNYAFISTIIVFFLEILSILAYWYQYVYHANCEKEAVNFEILPIKHQPIANTTQADYLKEMRDLLQSVVQGNQGLQLIGNTVNPNAPKVGFTFGLQKEVKETENNDSDNRIVKIAVNKNEVLSNGVPPNRIIEGNRICKHCGKAYIYKHHKQQYCSKECRDTAWEQRTGKKLIFRKK